MRVLHRHLTTDRAAALTVKAADTPAPGYANSRYEIEGFNTIYNKAGRDDEGNPAHFTRMTVIFKTPNQEDLDVPADGVTPEALLAVIGDHLNSLRQTPNGSDNTSEAEGHIKAALRALTKSRALIEETDDNPTRVPLLPPAPTHRPRLRGA